MVEAEGLAEEDPDGADDLIDAAEEILDEASGIIKKLMDADDDKGVDSAKTDDDHVDDEEPETTM